MLWTATLDAGVSKFELLQFRAYSTSGQVVHIKTSSSANFYASVTRYALACKGWGRGTMLYLVKDNAIAAMCADVCSLQSEVHSSVAAQVWMSGLILVPSV